MALAASMKYLARIPGAGARAVFHWLSDHGIDIIAVVGLVLSWRNHVYHLEERIDIGLYDETCSLISGVFLRNNPFPGAESSPFYDVWYFLLSKIVSDNTALYYFNYKIGMLLLAVLAYLCLRAGNVSIVAAFLASSFVLFCQSNLYTWPRVCHLALGVLLAGLALALASRRKTAFILILALTSLVTSYVRPEFFVPYILLFIYLIYKGARSKRLRSMLIPAGGLALAGILAVSILGCPIVDKEKRSFVAFTQHFALNWIRWNSSNLNPWTDASTIRVKCFGQANTVPKCIMANPGLVMRHVLTNARIAPGTLLVGLRPTMPLYDGVIPPKRASGLQWIALMLLATVMARGWSKSRILANWKEMSWIVFPVFLLMIPSFLSILLIYPRDHYSLLVPILIGITAMILLRTPGIEDRFYQALAVLGLASFLLFLTPDSVGGAVAAQPVRQTILLLNSFPSKTSGLVLEPDYDYCIYTPRLRSFSASAKHSPFNSFLAENKFDVIIVTEGMLNNPNYRNDPEWAEFAKNYNKFGFVRMDVPTVRTQYLLVREEMARRSGKPYYIPVKENQPGQPGIDAGAPPVP